MFREFCSQSLSLSICSILFDVEWCIRMMRDSFLFCFENRNTSDMLCKENICQSVRSASKSIQLLCFVSFSVISQIRSIHCQARFIIIHPFDSHLFSFVLSFPTRKIKKYKLLSSHSKSQFTFRLFTSN